MLNSVWFLTAAPLLFVTLMYNVSNAQLPEIRSGDAVPRDVREMYDRGLQYLMNSQSENGDWSDGQQGAGTTGMAVMCFLASGEDPNFGPYAGVIRRAIRSMIRSQDGDTGYFGNSMYHHGFAMLGLSEVYGVLDETTLWDGAKGSNPGRSIAETLELAVRCSVTSQDNNQWGAWRYSPETTDADTSVSGAVLMGLFAARNAGIKVPDTAIEKALKYYQQMTTSQGEVGYSGIGGGGSGNLKAISSLVMAIGHRKDFPQYDGVLKRTVQNIEMPEYSYPFYNRYYMAQALFQGDFDAWNRWNTKTIRELKELQSDDGSFQSNHGRAYGTAMSMLALALNYRFLPIYER
ncbi:MAG: squalene--hopene cyclase [Planctomycetaceae bacterium]|nr:squalene--hopene cyclase [Planctomycetaceae bacterium]